jgi:hypothetical protein
MPFYAYIIVNITHKQTKKQTKKTNKQTYIAFPIPTYSVLALSHKQVHHISQSPRHAGFDACH